MIFAGLMGAISWNLITFWFGIPSSSSHALVGGMMGAAVAKGGTGVLVTQGIREIGVFIVIAPLARPRVRLHLHAHHVLGDAPAQAVSND